MFLFKKPAIVLSIFFTFKLLASEEKIIITADRILTDSESITSQTSIIEQKEIDKKNYNSIEEILKRMTNLNVVTSGSVGNSTSIFLRGTDASHTLVILDGIVLNDPTNPNRSFDFSKINSDNIEKIEILNGAQGLLYGSNAIGGVILITSKNKTPQEYKSEVGISLGSFNTSNLYLSTSQEIGKSTLSFSATHLNSDGFSSANDRTQTSDRDGVFKSAYNLNLAGIIDSSTSFDFRSHFISDRVDLDKGGGDHNDDPNYKSKSQEIYSKAEITKDWTELFQSKFLLTYTNYLRRNYDQPNLGQTYDGTLYSRGYNYNFSINNNYLYSEKWSQDFNVGTLKESDFKHSITNSNFFLYNKIELNQFNLNLGVRLDYNQIFKEYVTYKLGASKKIGKIILRSSAGTGFRAPSLNQLYDSQYGNINLNPEKSYSIDLGIEFENNKFFKSITNFYYNKIFNRLSYRPVTFVNINSGEATIFGIEKIFDVTFNQSLSNILKLNLTEARSVADNLRLSRRPEFKANNALNFLFDRQSLEFQTEFTGMRFDVDNSGNETKLASSIINHLEYTYNPTKLTRISVKVKNIFNQNYEEVWGYNTGGRAITLGYLTRF